MIVPNKKGMKKKVKWKITAVGRVGGVGHNVLVGWWLVAGGGGGSKGYIKQGKVKNT